MDTDKKELGAQLAYAALDEVPNSKADAKEQQSRKPAVRKRLIFNLKYGCRNTVAMMQVSDRGRKGRHDSRRHALAMLRIAAVLSSLNCILRRNYLAKDRRAQNALLVSWYPRPGSYVAFTQILSAALRNGTGIAGRGCRAQSGLPACPRDTR